MNQKNDFLIRENILLSYEGNEKNVVIPEGVTEIGHQAFFGSKMESVIIPKGVTKICYEAFYGSKLKSVVLPEGVTILRRGAFCGCEELETVILPESLVRIERVAFSVCYKLKTIHIPKNVSFIHPEAFAPDLMESITVAKENPYFHTAGNCLIETQSRRLLCACKNSVIPTDGSVITIGEWSFSSREDLTEIELPPTIESIEKFAFFGCENLRSICFPESIQSIGNCAFWRCKNLKEIHFPESVKRIGDAAFESCEKLCKVSIPKTLQEIGSRAFAKCPSLADDKGFVIINQRLFGYFGNEKAVTIPNEVKSIENPAFLLNETLEKVILGKSITSIGNDAFAGCENLCSVELPEHPLIYSSGAFRGCPKLADEKGFVLMLRCIFGYYGKEKVVTIPEGTRVIGYGAFRDNKTIEEVFLPESVVVIDQEAFAECPNLKKVHFSRQETKIQPGAFRGCKKLLDENGMVLVGGTLYYCFKDEETVVLPVGIKEITNGAFGCCENIRSIVIPEGCEVIRDCKLKRCSETPLVVSIPKSVKEIEWDAFFGYNFILRGYKNSTAEAYALENDVFFQAIEEE